MSTPKTLFEKVWEQHVVAEPEGEPTLLYIDLQLVHEVTSPQAFEGLRLSGREPSLIELVETYSKAQGLWHDPDHEPSYSEKLELDLSTVEPSLAGPKRPQDRVSLKAAKAGFRAVLSDYASDEPTNGNSANEASKESFPASDPPAVSSNGAHDEPHAPGRAGNEHGCRWAAADRPVRTPRRWGRSAPAAA